MKQLTTTELKSFFSKEGLGGSLLSIYGFGPCDGGCLIVAKSLIMAHGRGEIVHIAQLLPDGELPHHYGALIDGEILDGVGRHPTAKSWLKVFRWDVSDKIVRMGFPLKVVARDEPWMVKQLAQELMRIK